MVSLLLVFFLVSLVFSFLCSLWEAVLLSITPSWAEGRMREGSPVGAALADFKRNVDRPLAAILTLNTIAHTVGAIGVGAQATRIWADSSPLVTSFVVPAAMTLAILVFSEIVPKTLGAVHWRRLASFTVRSLGVLIMVLGPFVWMSRFVTASLKSDDGTPVLTRGDLVAMAELGEREGVLAADERHIISSLVAFRDIRVSDVMTPRTVVAAFAEEDTVEQWFDAARSRRFSRLPTYHQGSKDRITGYVLKDELLEAMIAGKADSSLGEFRRELIAVPEEHPVTELFATLSERRDKIALVVDDFGGMAGVVTLEDVIETLLGMEIVDETDRATDMRELARRHRARRARAVDLIDGVGAPVEGDVPAAGDGSRDGEEGGGAAR